MARVVRGALVQASWTGDKESMIQKHEERAHEAARQGAQFVLFQELFYGPYFCQVQDPEYYSYTELIPDGPTTKRMQALAKETGMVVVAPMYEEDAQAVGHLLQHRRGHRRRRHVPGQVPQDAHPARQGLLGEVLLPARQPGLSRVPDRHRKVRRVHLLRPPLPRGGPSARASTGRRSCSSPAPRRAACRSTCGASSNPPMRSPTATTSARSTASASSRWARTTSTGRATSATRAASSSARWGTRMPEELIVRDLDLDLIDQVRQTWQFYRDRRPDAYDDLVRP